MSGHLYDVLGLEDTKFVNDFVSSKASFRSLVNKSSTQGGYFQFKSEKSWTATDSASSEINSRFRINLSSLAQNLSKASLFDSWEVPCLCCAEQKTKLEGRYGFGKACIPKGDEVDMFDEHTTLLERLYQMDKKIAEMKKNSEEDGKTAHKLSILQLNTVSGFVVNNHVENKPSVIDMPSKNSARSTMCDELQKNDEKNDLPGWLEKVLDE